MLGTLPDRKPKPALRYDEGSAASLHAAGVARSASPAITEAWVRLGSHCREMVSRVKNALYIVCWGPKAVLCAMQMMSIECLALDCLFF